MFNRKTLFVLGAGSSAEVDLPVGKTLAQNIGRKMDILFELGHKPIGSGDMDLYNQMTGQFRNNVQEFQSAALLIRDGIGLAQSIDDFLDIHRNNAHLNLYGKAAIVKAILEAERGSKLYFDRNAGTEFDASRLANTWFVKFTHMLSRGIPRENVREIFDHVSFINFNYDRCVEHFLVNALRKLHGIREGEAVSIVDDLNIIHPYGAVDVTVPFGATRANYRELAAGIRTYTEQIGEDNIRQRIANEIDQAECIIFLGFAYHRQNLSILAPNTPISPKPVFGTAYGMSDADVDVTSHQLDTWFSGNMSRAAGVKTNFKVGVRPNIQLENKLTSAALFDNYARSLSGGD
jgi:hypothetical protein